MGIFGSKQNVVPTTVACTMPRKRGHRMHLLAVDESGSSGSKQCADVRSTIDWFAPLGFLESMKLKTERGVTTYTYTYAWPLPPDETIARLLAGIWKYTETRRVVTERDNTGGGLMYTAVGGNRIVSLGQMISGPSGWYPAPIETSEVEADVTQFKWDYVKKELEKTLTRDRWNAWRSREANTYSATGATSVTGAAASGAGAPRRKQIIVARWENTVGAILLHYQAVMHEAICTLSQQCREGAPTKRAPTKGGPTKRAPTKSAKRRGVRAHEPEK